MISLAWEPDLVKLELDVTPSWGEEVAPAYAWWGIVRDAKEPAPETKGTVGLGFRQRGMRISVCRLEIPQDEQKIAITRVDPTGPGFQDLPVA